VHPPPINCRTKAFELFARQMPVVDTTEGLMRAAVAISMHELPRADPADVDHQIQRLADRVRKRLRSRNVHAVLAHLHDVLFAEEGFAGNVDDYYNVTNSYLPVVLDTRRGIPISLTMLYKFVAERLGLPVEGVNAPGHFLARVVSRSERMLVDPFYGGRVMTDDEAFERIRQATGQRIPPDKWLLKPATHVAWLARMLTNVQNIFAAQARQKDLAAMVELRGLLGTGRAGE
jgi:regulator of sirC expression with transglutaminase-like and TPR domain